VNVARSYGGSAFRAPGAAAGPAASLPCAGGLCVQRIHSFANPTLMRSAWSTLAMVAGFNEPRRFTSRCLSTELQTGWAGAPMVRMPLYLRRPEQRDGCRANAGERHVHGRDRNEAALEEGERWRETASIAEAVAPPAPMTEPARSGHHGGRGFRPRRPGDEMPRPRQRLASLRCLYLRPGPRAGP
jgi:hypothetical protein